MSTDIVDMVVDGKVLRITRFERNHRVPSPSLYGFQVSIWDDNDDFKGSENSEMMVLNIRQATIVAEALMCGTKEVMGNKNMVESDRQKVICALAADLYNENGDMIGTKFDKKDLIEWLEYYKGMAIEMGIRKPTEVELLIALRDVMGAEII